MIGIVDYGLGNLRSVEKAFEAVGAEAVVTSDEGRLAECGGLVLPGVGAFAAKLGALALAGAAAASAAGRFFPAAVGSSPLAAGAAAACVFGAVYLGLCVVLKVPEVRRLVRRSPAA